MSQTEAEEPAQTSDESSLPSTSQEPSSSSAGTHKHTSNYADCLKYLIADLQTVFFLFQTQAALSLLKPEQGLADNGLVVVVLGAL